MLDRDRHPVFAAEIDELHVWVSDEVAILLEVVGDCDHLAVFLDAKRHEAFGCYFDCVVFVDWKAFRTPCELRIFSTADFIVTDI